MSAGSSTFQVVLIAALSAVAASVAAAVAVRFLLQRLLDKQVREAREAERRARATEHLAEIGAMTAGLAHEIKNPLSTIGLNAQLLAEKVSDTPLPEDEREPILRRLQGLGREVERLRGILSDFLDFAGELHLSKAATDLNTLADELTDFFMPQASQMGIRMRCDPAPAPVIASIDERQVKQAALNLILNASQAMTQTGEDREVTRELILKVTTRTENDQSEACLHVIDTGPGIPDEIRERIFVPYFTTKGSGTGLGLAMTKRIVHAHDGVLDVMSEPGKGADFVLRFPMDSAHESGVPHAERAN